VEEPPLHHLPEVPLLLETPQPLRRKRRRLRVRNLTLIKDQDANIYTDKEESDEDMGFGLFD